MHYKAERERGDSGERYRIHLRDDLTYDANSDGNGLSVPFPGNPGFIPIISHVDKQYDLKDDKDRSTDHGEDGISFKEVVGYKKHRDHDGDIKEYLNRPKGFVE